MILIHVHTSIYIHLCSLWIGVISHCVINLLVNSLFVTHLDAVQNKMAELFICNYGAKSLEQALNVQPEMFIRNRCIAKKIHKLVFINTYCFVSAVTMSAVNIILGDNR